MSSRLLLDRVGALIVQLDELLPSLEVDRRASEILKVAAFAHCELIRIHPFVNGNGRTARLCVNYFAARYGFLPVDFSRPEENYLPAIQAWIERRHIDPMVEFLRANWREHSP